MAYGTLYGRDKELAALSKLKDKKTSSLVVINGRRRIGKSALAEEYGKSFKKFYEFQGIFPRREGPKVDQLQNFAEQVRAQFGTPKLSFQDWTEAFSYLARLTSEGDTLILLDEISWMATGEADFAGRLKIAWDVHFKKNPNLVMILCGSVSSWIEQNILKNAEFVGRVSSVIRLKELDLKPSAKFFGNEQDRYRPIEIVRLLSITGCIPKYLEEVSTKDSVNANIKRLCFTSGGYLFEDFDRIFSDVFGAKSGTYRKIVSVLTDGPLSIGEVCVKLKQAQNGEFTKSLEDLVQSGFIARYHNHKPDGTLSKLSRFRISDNYLRFYLKYILPNKERIAKENFTFNSLEDLPGWQSICGLQFENLILNRLPEILPALGLEGEKILSASPYFQTKTTRSEACQIDLLIACKTNSYYVCEVKFREKISLEVIREVKKKIAALKFPKRSSFRPVLLYSGELDRAVIDEDYFDRILDIGRLLKS